MRHSQKMPTQMRRSFDPFSRRRKFFSHEFITTLIFRNNYINKMLSETLSENIIYDMHYDVQIARAH